jgi:SAM-dependent methyltransferase
MTGESSFSYHPPPFSGARDKRGYRKVQNRLRAMMELCDFRGASILDLCCSGGYFSFELARYAKHILAIDADEYLIQKNREMSRQLGIANLTFEVGLVSPSLIYNLERFDITLFLSVLHHIITGSGVYVWNKSEYSGIDYGLEILKALAVQTDSLFFEVGQANEAHDWARHLPQMEPRPDLWIVKKLLGPAGFRDVTVIEPPGWRGAGGLIRKLIHPKLEPLFTGSHLISRALRRITSYDTRDSRYMFMAKSQSDQ